MLIGTAGHIDHGKTSLVKALTGVDADRLPEEKARGITLDLGYAYSDDGRLAFIDVPGHEKLIHNMLAGATGIDCVLLVVAADDGPMPQTREHLQILDLLGIARGVVALTKADTVGSDRLAEVDAQMRALLAGTALRDAAILATSTRTGQGIEALRALLHAAAETASPVVRDGHFRLAVDRCFTIAGAGTVVTGTVHAGHAAVEDALVLSPAGIPVRVRALQSRNREARQAAPGQRCALNLTGDGFARTLVQRGDWIVAPAQHRPTQCIDVRLRLLAAPALAHWTPVHLHLAAVNVTGRVALLEGDALQPGDTAYAQLLLDRPIGASHADRFIVRDQSASRTLGGGHVLDPFARARGRRRPAHLQRLRALAIADDAEALAQCVALSPEGTRVGEFLQLRNLRDTALPGRLVAARGLRAVADEADIVLFAAEAWADLRACVQATMTQAHEREPDMQGVSRERLRRMMARAIAPACFDALVAELLAEGVLAQSGAWLHLPGHKAAFAPDQAALWARLTPLLESQPAQPPRVRDLAATLGEEEHSVRAALKRAARIGEAYPVAHDHFYRRDAVLRLAAIVARIASEHGSVNAANFRDAIGTGRKLAIHLLEFFDRIGYTRRVGDSHLLRNRALFGEITSDLQ